MRQFCGTAETEGVTLAIEGHGLTTLDTPENPRLVHMPGRRIEPGRVLAVHVAVRQDGAETTFGGGPAVIDQARAPDLPGGKD